MQSLLGNEAISAAMKSGNVNISSNIEVEEMELSKESKELQLKHAETLRRFEAQQRARTIIVPTSIDEVKKKLRELGQPVTYFGEGPADRRERLKEVIARMELSEGEAKEMQNFLKQSSSTQVAMPGGYGDASKTTTTTTNSSSTKEVFYSPAIEQLVEVRKYLCEYSFPRTHERILRTKRIRENETLQAEEDKVTAKLYVHAKSLNLDGSQFADFRPISCVRFSPDDSLVAVGSWTGSIKLWNSETLERIDILGGHLERATSVSWQPISTSNDLNSSNGLGLLASSSADGKCILWDCRKINKSNRHIETSTNNLHYSSYLNNNYHNNDDNDNNDNENNNNNDDDMELTYEEKLNHDEKRTKLSSTSTSHSLPTTTTIMSQNIISQPTSGVTRLSTLSGHQGGITKCNFHPTGRFIGTAGIDSTWRFWDVETSIELQLQDGHVRECNAIDFHNDGSLVATGDIGGVVLVWDLRSGQSIHSFLGHIKKIVSTNWNINGYQLATGSTDNTVKIWDLRSKKCSYTLPAHSHAISEARFSKSGEILLTSSFDKTIKLWNTRDYDILKTLSGHTSKIMCCDISNDEKSIMSGSYDRTIKLWKKGI